MCFYKDITTKNINAIFNYKSRQSKFFCKKMIACKWESQFLFCPTFQYYYILTHIWQTKRKNKTCRYSFIQKNLINCDFKRLNNIYYLTDFFSELVSCPHALFQPTSTILLNSEKCFAYRDGCCANPFAQHCRYNCSVLFQLQQLTTNNFTEVS